MKWSQNFDWRPCCRVMRFFPFFVQCGYKILYKSGEDFSVFAGKASKPQNRFYNKQTIKISYSTVRNLKAHITSHNRKILSPPKLLDESCNCQDKSFCVMPGKCRARDLVYRVKATTQDNDFTPPIFFKSQKFSKSQALVNKVKILLKKVEILCYALLLEI